MCLVVGFKLGYLVHWPYQLLSQMCLAVGFKLGYWCIDLTSLFVFACCSEGGFFNAIMSFPSNYPNSPPSVRFTSEIWHPNGEYLSSVFEFLNIVISLSLSLSWTNVLNLSKLQFTQMEIKVCISILHPPGDDPNGYERASERWSPVHTVCFDFSKCCFPCFTLYIFSPLLWIEFLLIHYIFVFSLGLDLVIINSSTLTAF